MGTANSNENNGPVSYDILWQHTFSSDIRDVKVIDKSLFVASDKLFAFNIYSKELLWDSQLNCSCLCVYGNVIYACEELNNETYVNAVSGKDGSLLWTEPYEGMECKSMIPFEDKLLLTTFTDENEIKTFYFYVLKRYTGEVLWKWKKNTQTLCDIAIYDNNIFTLRTIENDSQFIYCFDFNSSEPIWFQTFGNSNYFMTVSDNRSLYILDENGISCIDPSTNLENWSIDIDNLKDLKSHHGSIYASSGNKLYSIDSVNGTFNWVLPIKDTCKVYNSSNFKVEDEYSDIFRFELDDDSIYLSTYHGIHKISSNGKVEWSEKIDKLCFFGVVVNEVIFTEVLNYPTIYINKKCIGIRSSSSGVPIYKMEISDAESFDSTDFSESETIAIVTYRNRTIAFSPIKEAAERNLNTAEQSLDSTYLISNSKSAHKNLNNAKKAFESGDYFDSLHYSNMAKEQAEKSIIRNLEILKLFSDFIFGINLEGETLLEGAKIDYENEDYASFVSKIESAQMIYAGMYDQNQLKNMDSLSMFVLVGFVCIFFIIFLIMEMILVDTASPQFFLERVILFMGVVGVPIFFLLFFMYSVFIWTYYSDLYSSLFISKYYGIGFIFLLSYLLFVGYFIVRQVLIKIPPSFISIVSNFSIYVLISTSLFFIVSWNAWKLFLSGIINSELVYSYWRATLIWFLSMMGNILSLFSLLLLIVCFAIIFMLVAFRNIFLLEVAIYKAKRKGDLESYISLLLEVLEELNNNKYPDLLRFWTNTKNEVYNDLINVYYEIGDYDNCLKYLKDLNVSNKEIQDLYRGIFNPGSFNDNKNPCWKELQNSLFFKFNKGFSFIKAHYNFKLIYMGYLFLFILFTYYVLFLVLILFGIVDGSTLIFPSKNLPLPTIFRLMLINSLFVFGFMGVIFTSINIGKNISLILDLFENFSLKITGYKQDQYNKIFIILMISFILIWFSAHLNIT